mmetsp:Transcript_4865/g.14677  ORF Transcript_4865/g.14677 Transcript_4865/m.14677 type:complete len:360 (+) Transcript_4865:85-1164(+)|eukprot:CAMPEP_0198727482 /NCGR_PEP_ID=MMETSP1475-20131203/4254_1 /TAXON_ID= ORGANISM="Unidentified sp., Strain CCMP1999" /NCGR_SAMPLE_ID=MMETSP1475 /ASSEMBLY_ACC=CAM_ASM_001111 /LENGTH=359 /DNA_ID=CAMNT_0044489527 /DNA_START=72 /DNA_END=1151 /DNA_ORIENTATION=+
MAFVGSGTVGVRRTEFHGVAVRRHGERPVGARVVQMGLLDRARKDWEIVRNAVDVKKVGQALATVVVTSSLMLAPLSAMAAQGGGRMGGSSFRSAPSGRSYSAPSRTYTTPGPTYGAPYGGGVYVAPPIMYGPTLAPAVLAPSWISILGVVAVGSLLLSSVLSAGDRKITQFERSTVSVVKVGLLSSARELQYELESLARNADTSTEEGLSYVLSEASLSLLRHPDYWTHASVETTETADVESVYGQKSMGERAKINEFTLSNVNSRRIESERARARDSDLSKAPSEYIYVTMIIASRGKLQLPDKITSADQLREALMAVGGLDQSQLQAVEVLWAPQSQRDSLTHEELTADNPDMRRF